tara:strand:+ start:5404 stop:5595 length:192 start_codon:yes stop_codon:yes gene_type:complete
MGKNMASAWRELPQLKRAAIEGGLTSSDGDWIDRTNTIILSGGTLPGHLNTGNTIAASDAADG